MKINKPAIEKELESKNALTWKSKLIIFLLIIIFALVAAFYWYYATTQASFQEAQKLQNLSQILKNEKENCGQVISQGQGEFAKYEYCTTLLNTFK